MKLSIKLFLQISVFSGILLLLIFFRIRKINLTYMFLENKTIANLLFTEITTISFLILLIIAITNITSTHIISSNSVRIKLYSLFNQFFYQPLITLDKMFKKFISLKYKINRAQRIYNYLPYIYNYICKTKRIGISNKYFFYYLVLKILPKIIAIICFSLDVLWFNSFYYFYWSVPLLIIPLLLRYIKYVIFEDHFIMIELLKTKIEIIDIIPSTPKDLIPMLLIEDYLNKAFEYHLYNKPNPYKNNIGLSYYYFQTRTDEERKKILIILKLEIFIFLL